jgi:hypothetical protein
MFLIVRVPLGRNGSLFLEKEMKNEEEMRNFLREEFGREPSRLEVEAAMVGARAGQEVMDRLAEMTFEEFLAAIKNGIN